MTAYEIMKISEHETGPGSEGTKTTEGEGEPKERHPENRRTCQEADDLGTEHMNIAAARKLNYKGKPPPHTHTRGGQREDNKGQCTVQHPHAQADQLTPSTSGGRATQGKQTEDTSKHASAPPPTHTHEPPP